MEQLESSNKKAMEGAVKRIYEIHRLALLDASKICGEHKSNYERMSEKYKKLQLQHESMVQENKRLRSLLDDNVRGGNCCASLRQALDTLSTSYGKLLTEKDARIGILEEKLKKYRRDSVSEVDGVRATPDITRHDSVTPRSTSVVDISIASNKSPDSTSQAMPRRSDKHQSPDTMQPASRHRANVTTPGGQDDNVVLDSPEKSPNCSTRLRLQRTRAKRSRYTEADLTDSKKPRQVSPKSAASNTATDDCTKQSKKLATAVFVPDTCLSGLDESFQLNASSAQTPEKAVAAKQTGQKSRNSKKTPNRKRKRIPAMNYDSMQIIPDTMDMFADCRDDSDEESQDTDNVQSQGWTVTVAKTKQSEQKGMVQNTGMYKGSLKSDCDSNKTDPNKQGNDLHEYNSRRCVLESPQSDFADQEVQLDIAISHRTLDLSTSVVDSDEETNTVVEKQEESNVSSARPCVSKSPSIEKDASSGRNVSPTFSKQRAEQMKKDDTEPQLRRSPRRHKDRDKKDASTHNAETSKSSRRTLQLECGKGNHRSTDKTANKRDSSHHRPVDWNENTSTACDLTELDMTVAPDDETLAGFADSGAKSVTDKVFQVRDVQNKSIKITDVNNDPKSKQQIKSRIVTDSEIPAKEFQSPSLLSDRRKVTAVDDPDVITIGSPSVGSMSDPESPLLLQRNKKGKGSVSMACSSQGEHSTTLINFKSKSHNANHLSKKSISRPSHEDESRLPSFKKASGKTKILAKGDVYTVVFEAASGAENTSKSLRQTTLTQRFFASPQKSNPDADGMKSPGSDNDIQEAIRLSLEEMHRSQNGEDMNDIDVLFNKVKENSPPFKKPRLPKRGAKTSKPLFRKHNDVETIYLDETMPPNLTRQEDDASVLHELNDQSCNIQSEPAESRLNGSLDPAVELTDYVAGGETLDAEHAVTTETSLPSLDLDMCTEDLHRRKTSTQLTQGEDDSQDIPSSSRSYKFGPIKKIKKKYQDTQEMTASPQKVKMDDSFDRLPSKAEPEFAHVTVVRKRDERQKLTGHSCKECYDYYKSKGLPESEIQQQIQTCSRHRAKHLPPATPPHFWSIGFVDTQECVDRGYVQVEDPEQKNAGPSYRRRRRLAKNFKSKNETSACGSDIDD